ncbi:glycosyltransferase family 2 protein [Candidatus Altiarchaeota archaeon]
MKSISIVLPALNEEGVVGETVNSIPKNELEKMGLEVEIIVVDNNSEDNTAEEAKKAGARVLFEQKKGYGNAYVKGFNESSGDIIVMADSDGTYPLTIIPQFIQPILSDEADFVIGSRLKGKIHGGAMPWHHQYLGNPLLTGILNLMFKAKISDAHCGMRAFSRKALEKLRLRTTGMEFASEMVIDIARSGLRIKEIPIEYFPRGGKAKLNSFTDGWRHLRFMMLYNPTFLFIIPGSILFLLGLLLVLLLMGGPIPLIGNMGLDIHPMILGNFLVILGFQILVFGLFAHMYAVVHGITEPDGFSNFFLKYNNLEIELLVGILLFLLGFLIDLRIVYYWFESGFGELGELRNAILSSTIMFIGIQLIFSSLFLSVLLLDKGD